MVSIAEDYIHTHPEHPHCVEGQQDRTSTQGRYCLHYTEEARQGSITLGGRSLGKIAGNRPGEFPRVRYIYGLLSNNRPTSLPLMSSNSGKSSSRTLARGITLPYQRGRDDAFPASHSDEGYFSGGRRRPLSTRQYLVRKEIVQAKRGLQSTYRTQLMGLPCCLCRRSKAQSHTYLMPANRRTPMRESPSDVCKVSYLMPGGGVYG